MEIIIELLLEVFLEVILTALAEGIGALVVTIDGDKKLKNTLKLIFTYSILILTIFLIVMSLIYSKEFLTIIATSYMLSILILRLIKRINIDKFHNKVLDILVSIFKRIINYGYPIVLIVFSSIYLSKVSALVSIIIISSIAIILWFSIDMYKIWKNKKIKNAHKQLN